MSVLSIWASVKTAAGAGILQGGYPFARNVYMVGDNVPTYAQSKATVAAALADVVTNDIILLGPKAFQEGNLSLAAGKNNITIIGMGNYGACRIEPTAAGDEGLNVLADDCTIINVGIKGNATGDYALKVGSSSVTPLRFRAYQSAFYGPTGANPAGAVVLQGALDSYFEECEFRDNSNALLFADSGANLNTRCRITRCLFHSSTTVFVSVISTGIVKNLWLLDNYFGASDAGVIPTDFIVLSDNANKGFITGNRFQNASNATGVITIGSGMIYNPNGTEAGWSTARPA